MPLSRFSLLSLLVLPALAFAQGALTPPGGAFSSGAPTATMKTLDQLEPRIPIGTVGGSTTMLTISAPGSYYLTGDVKVTSGNGIAITADDVTLDLNGFTISSSANPAAGTAIRIFNECQGIVIRNGHIRGLIYVYGPNDVYGTGFEHGVYTSFTMRTCLVTDLTVNGVSGIGICLDGGSTIDRCVVGNCGDTGIKGQVVSNCSATACGNAGIFGITVANSQGSAVNTGIEAISAINCTGTATTVVGLKAETAANCTGTSTSGIGLKATQNATGCTGTTASGSNGLLVGDTGAAGTAENCRGIVTDGTGTGLSAETASNCFGQSTAGTGLSSATASNCSAYTASGAIAMSVAGSANNCRGNNGGGGKAIETAIAIGCTSASGAISASSKYNMP